MMAAAIAATAVFAVQTRTWTQSESSDFEKGQTKGLALSSDGRLSLAPLWKDVADAGVAHLWCVARDAKGNIFAGGAEGKVLAVDAKGKSRTLATLEGGSVYALATGKGDEVYAAVSPEAKVYKIDGSGKSTLLATLKARYVWALVWGADGALYAATGDPGQIQRIAADGKVSLLFDAAEAHVRSMVADGKGNFIAGTEPGGVVLRVSPKGEGFVLYQTAKREVTALTIASDGTVYAAASGARTAATAPVAPSAAPPAPATGASGPAQGPARQTPPPPTVAVAPGGAGSEVYSIGPDGEPRRLWSHAVFTVYALAVGADGKVVMGTGNDGRVYRIDTPFTHTLLADSEPQQVTALLPSADGAVIGVTANPGKVFQMGPGIEKTGSIESDILDAGGFTYWGRLRHEAELNGGSIKLEARSGNLERAQSNWSPWTLVDPDKGERITAPAARYLGWRATLTAAPNAKSPVLKLVEAAYQAKNVAPVIERIEITPANYKFPASSLTASSASTALTLPAIGARKTTPAAGVTSTESGTATMNLDKGWIGARWRALDANGDALESKVEIRGADEREWKPLKDKLKETRYSWDATGLADGRYKLRVTVSDDVDNYPGQGLSAQMESEEFVIDNTPPQVEGLTARVEGNKIAIRFRAVDALTPLEYAEFSINGGEWNSARPTTGITDSLTHEYIVEADKPAGSEYTVAVKVADGNDNVTVRKVTVH